MAVLSCTRPPAPRRKRRGAAQLLAVLAILACGGLFARAPLSAQELAFPPKPPVVKKSTTTLNTKSGEKQMLVQAREIDYDYTNHRVSAVGNVQIYYGGSTIEADKVVYDQTNKRLHAEGNVRLTEPDGKITYGDDHGSCRRLPRRLCRLTCASIVPTRLAWPPPAPSAAMATSPSSTMASIPLACLVRTTRRSRRSGR